MSLYTLLQILSVTVFEKMPNQSAILPTPDDLTMPKTATSWDYSRFDRSVPRHKRPIAGITRLPTRV